MHVATDGGTFRLLKGCVCVCMCVRVPLGVARDG